MKKILIYTDAFRGNIIPTLGISEKLHQMGVHVHYMGIPDVTEIISDTSFPSTTIFGDYYPKGSQYIAGKINANIIRSIINGGLDELIYELNPTAIIFTAYNPIEAATFYLKYKLKTFLLYCHFPIDNDFSKISFTEKIKEWSINMLMDDANLESTNILINFLIDQGYAINSLNDIMAIFENFNNIIPASKDFLTENAIISENDMYVGSCIPEYNIFHLHYDMDKLDSELSEQKKSGKMIIYCSLGSWADQIDKEKAQQITQTLINSFRQESMKDYILNISVGNLFEDYQSHASDTIRIHQWLPQMAMLKHSDMAIIHGGMGGVKECIMNEIPMIVIPLGLDQFENADRIAAHQLGVKIDAYALNDIEITSIINRLQNNTEIKNNLFKMKSSFEKASESDAWTKFNPQTLTTK
ncbi:glycosyltransferase [Chryseobacterium gambrini]|uniref:Glycosyltransferase n=1 Tax=Chryseobacterium gambrini TaxID=373672 RepID=A0ABM8K305_9FLAO|nr:glycosyltransferase [Chryseobacterium gambrini]